METSKIRVKLGTHEFEAEGPVESVQAQFEVFRQMLTSIPTENVSSDKIESCLSSIASPEREISANVELRLKKMLRVEGRVISLTALPSTDEECTLLIMLGQKEFRGNDSVTGQEVGDGLEQSGRRVSRVDRIMWKLIEENSLLRTGSGRATRYRLTNQGLAKARRIADDILSTLP